jgi:catechol 2,3-dioxygenase-like lactoylglutathione lyase family enzyme
MPGVKETAASLALKDAAATIAVRDTKAARRFYESTLGLKMLDDSMPEALVFKSGSTRVLVYQSQFAGSNQATAATWGVGDEIEQIVQGLRAKGVTFEHYDLPGLTLKGDVHVGGNMKAAWFKDPDGNILALVTA